MKGFWTHYIRYQMPQQHAAAYQWTANHLPRELVLWCCVRVAAHGTMGKYGDTDPSTLDVIEAMRRWGTSNEGDPDATIQHAP